MWEEKYRNEQNEIKAPEFLKFIALQNMKEANDGSKNPFNRKLLFDIGLGFAITVIVFIFMINFRLQDPELVTDIVFERLDGGLRYFTGIRDNNAELVGLEEVEEVIGISSSDLNLEGFHLESASWIMDDKEARIQYFFAREGVSIQVMINNHTDELETNSILSNTRLALYYRVILVETTYTAEFLDDGIYYQIEATGLTEEEFIDLLEKMLN